MAIDPVENIYREVYPFVVNGIMTKHNWRLLHSSLRSFLKVRLGEEPIRRHTKMLNITKNKPIMFPVLIRNGKNELVEKTDSNGLRVYDSNVMDLRFS